VAGEFDGDESEVVRVGGGIAGGSSVLGGVPTVIVTVITRWPVRDEKRSRNGGDGTIVPPTIQVECRMLTIVVPVVTYNTHHVHTMYTAVSHHVHTILQ
jgi:hypothetical protein